jgi:hypothetical protein
MPGYPVVTAQAAAQYHELNVTVHTRRIPDFLEHDRVVARYWSSLTEQFPACQFCLAEQTSGTAVARGHSIPLAFDSQLPSLPDGGLDWVLEQGFLDAAAGRRPTIYSAL